MSDVQHEHERKQLKAGSRVGDHLVVRSILGQGGTAIVYEALHTRLGSGVALKVLNVSEEFAQDGALRLQREAEVCASIDDPHVPRIYDVGALPDGTPYVVMEKVSGDTLEQMLLSGPLSAEVTLEIIFDLLKALEAVHRAGVVHRDIKPANVIVKTSPDGVRQVRLMDFGVSKAVCREVDDPKLTRVGTVVGTPHYMAPEQITGEAVDARADLYATGVLMFEMLSGTIPFDGQSTAEIVSAVLRHEPRPLGSLRADLPKGLEAVVMRAMAPRPCDRFLTARDLVSALLCAPADSRAATQDQVFVSRDSIVFDTPALPSAARAREGARVSALSLSPPPRGFSHERPADILGGPSSSRRFSVLGAGVAVLIGTMGFPGAAKHGGSVEVARADGARQWAQAAQTTQEPPMVEAGGAALGQDGTPGAASPGAASPGDVPEAAYAPNVEADLGGALATELPGLDLGVEGAEAASREKPDEAAGSFRASTEELSDGIGVSLARGAMRFESDVNLRLDFPSQAWPKLTPETRASSSEEERAERKARRRLREAEEEVRKADREFERQEAARGVLLSDYVRKLEAIQKEAREQSDALPDVAESLPDNPYTHELSREAP